MNSRSSLLHPAFLCALLLLVVNDHVLKPEYHNWLTGKLSDFAGLFIFPVIVCHWFTKHRRAIYIATALLFTWWKSPLSQPFVNFLETANIPLTRVVDPTDLLALFVLPVSYHVFYPTAKSDRHLVLHAISVISLVVFCATSPPAYYANKNNQFKTDNRYRTSMSSEAFLKELDSLGLSYSAGERMNWYASYTDTVLQIDPADSNSLFIAVDGYRVGQDSIAKVYLEFAEEKKYNTIIVYGFQLPATTVAALKSNRKYLKALKNAYYRYQEMIRTGIIEPIDSELAGK